MCDSRRVSRRKRSLSLRVVTHYRASGNRTLRERSLNRSEGGRGAVRSSFWDPERRSGGAICVVWSCFRLWTCSFVGKSKLPSMGMQMYPLLHRRALGAPTTQPDLGQPYLSEPVACPRHFDGGRLVRDTWAEQMRRVYSGFGRGAFCALVGKPAR